MHKYLVNKAFLSTLKDSNDINNGDAANNLSDSLPIV